MNVLLDIQFHYSPHSSIIIVWLYPKDAEIKTNGRTYEDGPSTETPLGVARTLNSDF